MMSEKIFREGGLLNVRRLGQINTLNAGADPQGRRRPCRTDCPDRRCSPEYFKVKPGTGLTNQAEAFCPYWSTGSLGAGTRVRRPITVLCVFAVPTHSG